MERIAAAGVFLAGGASQTEIEQFDAVPGEENIGRLQVTVDNAEVVKSLQRGQDLPLDIHGFRRGNGAAGDTFRAAAIEHLKIWADRTGAGFMAREPGADAAGLAFDAVTAARERGVDVLLIDTAGRLQNRSELMGELEKLVRVVKKIDDSAPHSVLLVLDATVGQNALSQVEIFKKAVGVTGLAMTKLDGTARGGILVALAAKFHMPVHYIGVGEAVDDLAPFSARDFARAIAGLSPASS